MPGWAPVKFEQTGWHGLNARYSIFRCNPFGPTFGGGHDLRLHFANRGSYSNLGYTYGPPDGYSFGSKFAKTFMAGSFHFNPDEIETFYYAAFTPQGRFED